MDKDILIKDNKVYSPEACVFVPQKINNLFTKNNVNRGLYPIGVSYRKDSDRFVAQMNYNGNIVILGWFENYTEAYRCYKAGKENYIKEIADKYQVIIPQKLYDAMYRYEVEITD